jgi:16S rRNA G966 N2-methylase RsmD
MALVNIVRIYKANGLTGIVHAILEKINEYWYETRYDLDCRGRIEIDDLSKSVENERYEKHGVLFASAQFEWMRKGIDALPMDLKTATLLDLGSGKGRMTCYAMQRGFGKVIGVEWSPELCSISHSNMENLISSTDSKSKYEFINGDAAKYRIPDDVDVIWMFNPFTGIVLEEVLQNIQNAGRQKELYIIFANPPKESVTSKYFTLIKKIRPDYPRLFLYKTSGMRMKANTNAS